MNAPMGKSQSSIQRNVWAGLAIAGLVVGGVGTWAVTTDIAGAVIAPGALVVESNVRKVQHPTGGVVAEILVRDGDRVKAEDVVIRLDATITAAALAIVTKGLDEFYARKARLEAERDDRADVEFPPALLSRAADPDVAHLMAGERRLFELRRLARTGQKSQLGQRTAQLHQEIEGLTAQAAAKAQEIVLIQRELKGAYELWEKKLYPITKLTQLEREATRLDGERAQLLSNVAQTNGKITEIEMQVVQIDRDLASEVAKEMREIDAKVGEFLERKVTALDQLKRIDVRAPIDGVVHQSTVHTVGGVINPSGEPIMLIVPDGDQLIIEAKVGPQDIDQIHVGQPTVIRFVAFNQRTTPELNAKVIRISADAMVDQKTGTTFYTVRLGLVPGEATRLGQVTLVPGMTVEAFIRTGDRKVISYLMKPLTDQFTRALRER
jgi:HlyD family secretion protein